MLGAAECLEQEEHSQWPTAARTGERFLVRGDYWERGLGANSLYGLLQMMVQGRVHRGSVRHMLNHTSSTEVF